MDRRNATQDDHHERKTPVVNMKTPKRAVVALEKGEC
jgi:hypothetical protein